MRKVVILVVLAVLTIATVLYAGIGQQREAVDFHPGHSHKGTLTEGAPTHSGGLDRYGCHNGSVPYHCHRPTGNAN